MEVLTVISVVTCASVFILIISYVISQVGMTKEIIRLQEMLGEVAERCDEIDTKQDLLETEVECLRRSLYIRSKNRKTSHLLPNTPVKCEMSFCKSCNGVTCSIVTGNVRRCAKCGSFKSKGDLDEAV